MSYPEQASEPPAQPAETVPLAEAVPPAQTAPTQAAPVAPTMQFAAPPVAAPQVSMQPMQAPPVQPTQAYPPVSGPAYQAGQAPVSGPAYPVSGPAYPVASSIPYQSYPPAPAAPRKPGRLPVILLSVLSGLLVLALIGMTTLFVISAGDAKKKLDSLTAQLAERNQQLADTTKQLEAKAADLTKIQQDLDGSKAATAEQAKEKEAVAKCLDLIYDVLAARTVSEFNKRLKAADKPCDEADKYVDNF